MRRKKESKMARQEQKNHVCGRYCWATDENNPPWNKCPLGLAIDKLHHLRLVLAGDLGVVYELTNVLDILKAEHEEKWFKGYEENGPDPDPEDLSPTDHTIGEVY